ncbi:SDR family NAD(P)-dependent oxidoreductase [Mycolicibacterium septicum DSM 44393]|uniref:SDR family NAD(P)-dependent oxidoreductase n=1 Tax=Mycolicibacterium septicum DSM 44393 TaxID=1341646 RepID=A0A7X6RVQ6_9MYCO|nr:SDR family NAD(P)-dependent oxidoreductase [Mycolicibacterium septicum]NKZ10795.1 SDR family NAD(P)-dependent oxidoreductase [Mycolicibacterium septicum DSM 44393]
MKTWFITGASRGFGMLVAEEALRRGDQVVATARKPETIANRLSEKNRLLTVALDVTDESSISAAIAEATERFGGIDVLLNNAGHGIVGAVEEICDIDARAVFEVNVFGLLGVTRAVLPVMRAQRAGRLLHLSSVAGQTGGPGWGVYAATKHAVEALNESLRAELGPLGIYSTAIEPGAFRTDFLDSSSLMTSPTVIHDYETSAGTRKWSIDSNHAQVGDPVKAASIIVDIAHLDVPPVRLALGSDCFARFEKKFEQLSSDLQAWKDTTLSTDYVD